MQYKDTSQASLGIGSYVSLGMFVYFYNPTAVFPPALEILLLRHRSGTQLVECLSKAFTGCCPWSLSSIYLLMQVGGNRNSEIQGHPPPLLKAWGSLGNVSPFYKRKKNLTIQKYLGFAQIVCSVKSRQHNTFLGPKLQNQSNGSSTVFLDATLILVLSLFCLFDACMESRSSHMLQNPFPIELHFPPNSSGYRFARIPV